MSEADSKQSDLQVQPRPIKITVPKLGNINVQSKLTMRLGFAAFMLWLAHWLVFVMRPIASVFHTLLQDQLSEVVDEIPVGIRLIGEAGVASGIVYIALAGVFVLLALWLLRRSFRNLEVLDIKLSEIRLVSIVYGVVFYYLLVEVFSFLVVLLQVDPEGLTQLVNSLYGLLGGF